MNADSSDDNFADSFALPSADGQGETLEQLNSPCPWMMDSPPTPDASDSEDTVSACWAECYPDPIERAAGIHTGMTSYTPRMAYIRSTLQKILDFHSPPFIVRASDPPILECAE